MAFSLVRCGADGTLLVPIPVLSEAIAATYPASADLYRRVGFTPPWVSYVARTAAELVAIARKFDPGATITALTLREHNASTKILARLGFKIFGNAHDADAGDVWEWRN